MKKAVVAIVVFLCAIVLAVLITVNIQSTPKPTESSSSSKIQSYSTAKLHSSQESIGKPVAANKTPKYRIGEYKGKVAVFIGGRELPYMILKTQVDMLPESAQKSLKEGIPAKDEHELQLLLEDYES